MDAFGWGVKDGWVLGWFDACYFVVFGGYCEFGHAVGTGVMSLAWENAVVGYYRWLVECFFAALVGTLEFFFMLVPVENLHVNRLL